MTRPRIATVLILSLVAALLVTIPAVADEDDGFDRVLITEMSTRGPSGASDNFILITNHGDDDVDASGWQIQRCNNTGSGFVGTQVTVDDGTILEPGDDYLVAHDGGYSGDREPDATYGVSISDDGGARINDDGDIVDSVGFGTNENNCTVGDPGEPLTIAEGADGLSHHRVDDTGDNATDFEKARRSVDENGDEDPGNGPSCDEPTPIYDINEVGANGLPTSGMLGEDVAVEGIVTADFTDGLDAYFVQEPEFDENATDSHGIMTWVPGVDPDEVSVGDRVCATGEVDEFRGTVQLTNVDFEVLAPDQELPDVVELEMPVDDRTELAALAGTRVELTSAEGAMTVTQNYFQGRFGELDLSATGRLWNPTELFDPRDNLDAVIAQREDNLNSWIKLDDASSEQNPSPTPWLANGAERAGAKTTDPIVGITHYQHGNYRIQPLAPGDIEFTNEDNPRPDGPPDVLDGADSDAATVTVAGFNVLNYFTTLGERGASTEEEFELQAAKIVEAITKMDADVVGLMEIENNFGEDDDALQDLLDRLNDEAGEGTYDAVGQDELIGNDAISNALIFQPDAVTPAGKPAASDQEAFVNPRGADTERNRPAVTQAFEADTGDVFVVAVNHLKSKGSGCGEGDDDEWQGNCNGTRTDAAEELVRWLDQEDPTGTGADEIAIIGDINAYAQEDPIEAILDGGYQDALSDQLGEVYTYVFDGEHGRLDHALVSDAMVDADRIVDTDVWHINVDEPAAFDYRRWNNEEDQDESEFRSSDHDPIIMGLQFAVDDPEPEREVVFGDPRGRVMTGRTNVVPFSLVDGEGQPVDDEVTVVLTTSEGEREIRVVARDEPGAFHAQFSTETAGEATLTAIDADGNELGSTTVDVDPRPGGGPPGR